MLPRSASRVASAIVCVAALSLTGCTSIEEVWNSSGVAPSAESNLSARVDPAEWSCTDDGLKPGYLTCVGTIHVTNTGTAAEHAYGQFYAVADGKVFSDTNDTFGYASYVSADINPDETQGAVLAYSLPKGAHVSRFFLASSATDSQETAAVMVDVDLNAL